MNHSISNEEIAELIQAQHLYPIEKVFQKIVPPTVANERTLN